MGAEGRRIRDGFTLVELLVVMAVIAILTAITLGTSGIVQRFAATRRAAAEIQSLTTALESYKLENGVYPGANNLPSVNSYSPTTYVPAGTLLYVSLSGGKTTFAGAAPNKIHYHSFKRSQLGNPDGAAYVQDPFGFSYGYTTNAVMNPGFFDLWSTAGKTTGSEADTNAWINNWSER